MSYQSNDQFFRALRTVIDGWGELDKALRNLLAACHDDLTAHEQDAVHDLITATESVLYKK